MAGEVEPKASNRNDPQASSKIDPKQVEHVARLARLALTPEEAERFGRQLGEILDYVRKLGELDTEGIPPTSHVLPITNVMREDEPRSSTPRSEILKNAPDSADGYFRVPRIIESGK